MNEQIHQGGCLCGAVQYAFAADPIAAVHCHCTDCQKATGSGFATVFGLSLEDVEVRGVENLSYYTISVESGQTVTREFCRDCGSPLFTEAENNPGFLWIKAGSLDDSDWLTPTDCCWTGSATSWSPAISGLTHHSGNP